MVATQYSTLLGFSLKPSFHRCEMIKMAEQSLADIFYPSIMDFIEREPDSKEVDFELREFPGVDLQLDSDPVNPASPLQVDTAPNARPVQDLTSSPTHPKATNQRSLVRLTQTCNDFWTRTRTETRRRRLQRG